MTDRAFDSVAARYDAEFTDHLLGRLLRSQVRRHLEQSFAPGSHVLDLGCGTGEDAVWLAKRGVRVTAVDASSAMLDVARAKLERTGTSDRITLRCLDLSELGPGTEGSFGASRFDGAYSNFGALNCVPELGFLAESLSRLVRSGGRLVLVVMGPFCPWEVVGNLARGRPRVAFRRLRRHSEARVGQGDPFSIWYPSPRRVRQEFEPWFRPVRAAGVGAFLPPTDFRSAVERWPRLFSKFAALDRRFGDTFPATWLNDHHLAVLERR